MTTTDINPDDGRTAEELVRSFNVWDPALNDNPYPVLGKMRAGCPVGRSEELGGYWLVTSYAGVREVMTNPAVFSSRNLTLPPLPEPIVLIPETIDPPEHTAYRQIFTPLFSSPAMERLAPEVRRTARRLIEAFVAKGGGDFVREVAVPLPCIVFLQVLGLPVEDLDQLLAWKDDIMRGMIADDPVVSAQVKETTMPAMAGYFAKAIVERRGMADPPDDVLTGLVKGTFSLKGERPLSDEEIINVLFMLIFAGLDTVTAALSLSVETLATRPDLRQQLIEDPSLVPSAVEELLRYWSLITTGRQANEDHEVEGVTIPAGDYVLFSTVAASRDPNEFENPDEIDFRRNPNRHMAFGVGPHRCLGSHLARMEMRVALEEIHRAMPRYSLALGTKPQHRFGQVMGCDRLDLVVDPGPNGAGGS